MLDRAGLTDAAPYILLGVVMLIIRVVLRRSKHRYVHAIREILLIAPFVVLYFVARGFADARPEEAIEHARWLINLERTLGLFGERELQQLIIGHNWAIDLANGMYVYGHWPVIIATFVWLAINHPERIAIYRNALILSGLAGVVFFLTFEVAPPRLMQGYGFVDTITQRSHAYRVLQPPALTDLYASMPSLHVGWNYLMGVALVREASHRRAKELGVAMPVLMFAAVVMTANHYFLDGLVGIAIVTLSLVIGDWLSRRGKPDKRVEQVLLDRRVRRAR
jgi:membrane-associated phospholipid phosphatase